MIFYGFLVYAVVFMYWSLLSSLGLLGFGWWGQVGGHVIAAVATFVASRAIGIADLKGATLYGVCWAIEDILLDAVYVVPLAGIAPFFNMYIWIGYGVVFVTPFLAASYMRITSPGSSSVTS